MQEVYKKGFMEVRTQLVHPLILHLTWLLANNPRLREQIDQQVA
jgi:hypothetical protein